ncbi:putative oxidoreductase [Dokdonella fugitiva]|uniref:Putative oxidoreductase n=1 Tax=Dokdonella fugitiva TaxID=328517 RepID=A0A839F0A6_9GAMM|nr:DoxX family protein [Dokdonella fugitiva]MBA8886570.1 putative oxidoreductase [Dokdonella fugitiva]
MNPILARCANTWSRLVARLDGAGKTLPPFVLRLIMGWEFWESGLEKLHGENWFADIQQRFPFPFDQLPAGFSWTLSTWTEILGALLLWLGLGTRVAAFALLFVTFVATAAVHWPDMWSMWSDLAKGYAIKDMGHGNFKLPLLFAVMLLPLIFGGAGKFSLDHWLSRLVGANGPRAAIDDPLAWSLAAAVLGVPFLMLLPTFGIALLVLALLLAIAGRRRAVAPEGALRTS